MSIENLPTTRTLSRLIKFVTTAIWWRCWLPKTRARRSGRWRKFKSTTIRCPRYSTRLRHSSRARRYCTKIKAAIFWSKIAWPGVTSNRAFKHARPDIRGDLLVAVDVSPSDGKGRRLSRALFNGEANVWLPTSSPTREAADFAHFFGIEPDKVRMRVPYVGGGFGSKMLTNGAFAALFLSRQIRRPVRLVPSAEESFRQNARHAMLYKAKVGVKSDGTLMALDVESRRRYRRLHDRRATSIHNSVISAWGCYRIPHLRVHASACIRTRFRQAIRARPARSRPPGESNAPSTAWRDRWASIRTSLGRRMFCCAATLSARERRDGHGFSRSHGRGDRRHRLGRPSESCAGDSPRPRWARGRGMALSLRHGSQGGNGRYGW